MKRFVEHFLSGRLTLWPVLSAVVASIILHAMMAGALAFYLARGTTRDELARLDVTRVELSVVEDAADTTVPTAPTPATPAEVTSLNPTDVPPPLSLPDDVLPPIFPQVEALPSPAETMETLPRAAVREEEAKREVRDESDDVVGSASRQAHVDAPAKSIHVIRPDYPRESRVRSEQGDVVLELDVGTDGMVAEIRIFKSSGYPRLDEAAVRAARSARFTPAKSGGRAVASTVRLPLSFKLK